MELSIIIPTYNEEHYLPKLLESIKRQTFNDYEVIVADADSEDKTREIAHSYGCKVVKGGLPAVGRNSGVRASQGKYLLFLDSDVIITDNYIESALFEFKEKDLGIAITQMIPLSDKLIDKITHGFANFFMRAVESIKPHGAGCYGILTQRVLHDQVKGFDESLDFGEDSDYIERIGSISPFKVLRKPKLLVSTRRLEKEGLKSLAIKYTKSTLYDFLGKKISAEELNYSFDHSPDKKRIFYAVCGEGMGHAIRSGVIIDHLKQENEIITFSSGRAFQYLSGKFSNVYSIDGFNTVYEDNRAIYKDTFIKSMKELPGNLKNNLRLLYNVAKAFKPHVVISDFEFYSSLLSKLMRIPLISVDNIHVITQTEIEVPERYLGERIVAEGVIRSFILKPKAYLISTFFFPPVKNDRKVSLFPPVLREEIMRLNPKDEGHVLVYQTSDSNLKLIPLLKAINKKFVVYGFNRAEEDENIHFRIFNEDQFFQDLASCQAVITNGGFTLIGEALYLQKPILSIPIRGQFEQIINAIYIERLGYGENHEELDKSKVESFLENIDTYKKVLNNYRYNGNESILEKLDNLIEKHSKKY